MSSPDELPPDLLAIVDATRLLRTALERELAPSRELSIALTKLDECGMWAASGYARQHGAEVAKRELENYAELGDAMLGGLKCQKQKTTR
jgi:hypothetical protein